MAGGCPETDATTPEDTKALAAQGESETPGFKQSTSRLREAARAVGAMLNQRGGRVLFGITPGGVAVGQQVSEKTIEEVAGTLRQITPPAYPSSGRVPLGDGREVIVVTWIPGTGSRTPSRATPRFVSGAQPPT